MIPPARSSSRLPALDGLRAIAVLAVIVCHSDCLFVSSANSVATAWWRPFEQGVNLFFAISGLLITTLLVRERERLGRVNLRAFYVRRAFRILPPLGLYLIVVAVLTLLHRLHVERWQFLSSIFFYRNYASARPGVETEHFWSLSVEEHFYLLWPVCIALLLPRRAMWLALVGTAGIIAWRYYDDRELMFFKYFGSQNATYRTDRRLDALLLGSIGGLLLPHARKLSGLVGGGIAALMILGSIIVANIVQPPLVGTFLSFAYAALVFACVIWAESFPVRYLEWRWLRRIGVLSYSIYIWQMLWLRTAMSFSRDRIGLRASISWWLLDLALIAVCSSFSFLVIEQPIRRIGYRIAERLGSPHPGPASPKNETDTGQPIL